MTGESGWMNPPGCVDVTRAGQERFQLFPTKIREGKGIFNLSKKKPGMVETTPGRFVINRPLPEAKGTSD